MTEYDRIECLFRSFLYILASFIIADLIRNAISEW